MFVSTVNELGNLSKDELWRVASSRTTGHLIRRAAIRQWLALDERESLDTTAHRNELQEYARTRSNWPEDQPA